MAKTEQERAPIRDALNGLKKNRTVPFDIPGHKRGKGNPALLEFLGDKCLSLDVNSMKCLDNPCHPTSVIREAEQLAAEAFRASHAYFMLNGTSSAVQAMIMYAVKAGDKIILPRNVHRSVLTALVICGAVPVYVRPMVNERLGIELGMPLAYLKEAIVQNPDAKAVLLNNPTYYGICSDLVGITETAHNHGMLVLVDEAHGTHFNFGKNLPISGMAAGADLVAVGMHKSGGSLTQSSLLLAGPSVNSNYLRQIINLTHSTSGSYLLLASLDISRRYLAMSGKKIFRKVLEMAEYAREEINAIGGYYAYSREIIDGEGVFDFDRTKLSVNTLDLGIAGIEVYDILRDEYDIQAEFGDISNILSYISIGDRYRDIERLIGALADIKRRFKKDKLIISSMDYIAPKVAMTPQEAFYLNKRHLPIKQSVGSICAEFVMCYPPGIPILAPGEEITKEIVEYIEYSKEKGCLLTGPEDMNVDYINVLHK